MSRSKNESKNSLPLSGARVEGTDRAPPEHVFLRNLPKSQALVPGDRDSPRPALGNSPGTVGIVGNRGRLWGYDPPASLQHALRTWGHEGTNPNFVPCLGRSLRTTASRPWLVNLRGLSPICPYSPARVRSSARTLQLGKSPQGKGQPGAEGSPAPGRLLGGPSEGGAQKPRPGKS